MCGLTGSFKINETASINALLTIALHIKSIARGRDASGICIDNKFIHKYSKDVESQYTANNFKMLNELPSEITKGNYVIAHTRQTSVNNMAKQQKENHIQPISIGEDFIGAHNGVLKDHKLNDFIKKFELIKDNEKIDSEYLIEAIQKSIHDKNEVVKVLEDYTGAAALIFFYQGVCHIYHDSERPLYYFIHEGAVYLSSTEQIIEEAIKLYNETVEDTLNIKDNHINIIAVPKNKLLKWNKDSFEVVSDIKRSEVIYTYGYTDMGNANYSSNYYGTQKSKVPNIGSIVIFYSAIEKCHLIGIVNGQRGVSFSIQPYHRTDYNYYQITQESFEEELVLPSNVKQIVAQKKGFYIGQYLMQKSTKWIFKITQITNKYVTLEDNYTKESKGYKISDLSNSFNPVFNKVDFLEINKNISFQEKHLYIYEYNQSIYSLSKKYPDDRLVFHAISNHNSTPRIFSTIELAKSSFTDTKQTLETYLQKFNGSLNTELNISKKSWPDSTRHRKDGEVYYYKGKYRYNGHALGIGSTKCLAITEIEGFLVYAITKESNKLLFLDKSIEHIDDMKQFEVEYLQGKSDITPNEPITYKERIIGGQTRFFYYFEKITGGIIKRKVYNPGYNYYINNSNGFVRYIFVKDGVAYNSPKLSDCMFPQQKESYKAFSQAMYDKKDGAIFRRILTSYGNPVSSIDIKISDEQYRKEVRKYGFKKNKFPITVIQYPQYSLDSKGNSKPIIRKYAGHDKYFHSVNLSPISAYANGRFKEPLSEKSYLFAQGLLLSIEEKEDSFVTENNIGAIVSTLAAYSNDVPTNKELQDLFDFGIDPTTGDYDIFKYPELKEWANSIMKRYNISKEELLEQIERQYKSSLLVELTNLYKEASKKALSKVEKYKKELGTGNIPFDVTTIEEYIDKYQKAFNNKMINEKTKLM